MNIDDFLSVDKAQSLKERNKSQTDYDSWPNSKKAKLSTTEHLNEEEKIRILKMLENEPEQEKFNEVQLKKLLNQLEKKVTKNQEMRIKFPELPEKFMESEIELNETIQEMHVVSTRVDLYPMVLDSNCISVLLGLLSHENIDISAAVISLIMEMTDLEASSLEGLDNVKAMIEVLCDQQIFSLLFANLERFDETNKDEADAVHNSLAIVENIIEVMPHLSLDNTKQTFFQWLLKRIKVKGQFDANKLYAAELLSILVQNQDENRKLLGDLDGIDILLQQLAYYKRHDPSTPDEFEYMENLFNTLCSCLMLPSNRAKFLKGEGLQLMRLILREQKNARTSSLKVLNYAMNNLDGKENCQAFVEMLGLGVLFPLFMKPVKTKKKKEKNSYNNEEHIVSIIASLLKNCSGNSKQRVVLKFTENDFEKVDRLMELYFKYSDEVKREDLKIAKEKADEENEEEDDEMLEVEYYMRRLENGLFALQSICYIIMDIYINGPSGISKRIGKLLNLRNESKEKIIKIINEYKENLGEDEANKNIAAVKEESDRIDQLISKFQ